MQGYRTVEDLLSISIEDLEDVGFFKLGHQKRLLLGMRRVRELKRGMATHVAQVQVHLLSLIRIIALYLIPSYTRIPCHPVLSIKTFFLGVKPFEPDRPPDGTVSYSGNILHIC